MCVCVLTKTTTGTKHTHVRGCEWLKCAWVHLAEFSPGNVNKKLSISLSLSLSFFLCECVATLLMRSSLRHVRLWQTLLPYRKHSKQPHDTSNVSCRKTGKHFFINHHNKLKLTRNATLKLHELFLYCSSVTVVWQYFVCYTYLWCKHLFGWFCAHIFSVNVWWLCLVISIHLSIHVYQGHGFDSQMNECMNWENIHWIQCCFG